MKKALFLFSLLIIGCNAFKKVEYKTDFKKIPTKRLIDEIEKRKPNFNFIIYRAQATVLEKNSTNQFNILIRIEKNEKILITGSILIPLFKGLLTKEKIAFYEKLSRSYYKDRYDSLSSKLDHEVNLNTFQNLLVGLPIINLKEKKWKQATNNQAYSLQSLSKQETLRIRYDFSPISLRLISQEIAFNNNTLKVNYGKYNIANGQLFPEEIKIFLDTENKKAEVVLSIKTNKLGGPISSPFKIPKGYKQIKL
tara:strand:+ start:447 stop:1202 length:756 start_codon:yes stop_codon:yes gene_type:complete